MAVTESNRVAYVVKRYPRYSETFIVNEILAHEASGLSVVIFALRGPEDTHFQDIISQVRAPVYYLPDKLSKASEFWTNLQRCGQCCPTLWQSLERFSHLDSRTIAHGAALAEQVVLQGIHHLHAHFATSATDVAQIASKLTGIPFSFTAHAKDIFHESVCEIELGRKIRDAQDVITVSDFNLEDLSRRFPEQIHAHIHRIYNGMDLARFPYRSAKGRSPRIIAVGRLVEKKGFNVLIDACELLRSRGCIFECEIIGAGECQTTLATQIERLGLQAEIRLSGPRPQRDVIAAIQDAAVMAAPCVVGEDGNRDGLPTVVLESMALGTPCVGTDVTGMPEAIVDDVTGYCINQNDPTALADALQKLLNDAETRERFSRAGRCRIEDRFDVHKNTTELRRLFFGTSPTPCRNSVS